MNLDPAMMRQVLGAGMDPQADQVKRNQALINRLRAQSMEAPQQQMAGRILTPNFGQVGSNLMAGFQANRMQPGVDEMNKQVMQRGVNARQQYLQALMQSMRKEYPQAPGPVLPPDGMEDR